VQYEAVEYKTHNRNSNQGPGLSEDREKPKRRARINTAIRLASGHGAEVKCERQLSRKRGESGGMWGGGGSLIENQYSSL